MADIERLLYLSMESEVVQSLIAGNDTLCFTTQQYADARDQWIAKMCGATRTELGVNQPPLGTTRKQLLGSGIVREVTPDVWTLKSGGSDA